MGGRIANVVPVRPAPHEAGFRVVEQRRELVLRAGLYMYVSAMGDENVHQLPSYDGYRDVNKTRITSGVTVKG
jgi:hypothetical protein